MATTMAFRGTDVKEPLCANSMCWHIDWAQFNWSQQTARQGVIWELRKAVPGQYACRNLLGKEHSSSNGKLKCQGLMVLRYIKIKLNPKSFLLFVHPTCNLSLRQALEWLVQRTEAGHMARERMSVPGPPHGCPPRV